MATLLGNLTATIFALAGIGATNWWLGSLTESWGIPWWVAAIVLLPIYFGAPIAGEVRRTRRRALLGLPEVDRPFVTVYDRWWLFAVVLTVTLAALGWFTGRGAIAEALRTNGTWVVGGADAPGGEFTARLGHDFAALWDPSDDGVDGDSDDGEEPPADDPTAEPVEPADDDQTGQPAATASGDEVDEPADPAPAGEPAEPSEPPLADGAGQAPRQPAGGSGVGSGAAEPGTAPGGDPDAPDPPPTPPVAAPGAALPTTGGPGGTTAPHVVADPRLNGGAPTPGPAGATDPAPTAAAPVVPPPTLEPAPAAAPGANDPVGVAAAPVAALTAAPVAAPGTPHAVAPAPTPTAAVLPAEPAGTRILAAPGSVRVLADSGYERDIWPSEAIPPALILELPATATASPDALADHIAAQITDPYERIRASHDWIALNCRLDRSASRQIGDPAGPADPAFAAATVFDRRQGPAEGLSNLLAALLQRMGYETMTVRGTTAEGLRGLHDGGHAWTAVRVGDRWHLADVVLAIGCYPAGPGCDTPLASDWLFAPPEAFARDHVPDDPRWQLLATPLSRSEVAAGPEIAAPFFGRGLRWLAPATFANSATGEIVIRLDGVGGLPVQVAWWHALRTYPSRRCIGSGEGPVEYRCELPGPGLYRIHVRGPGSSGADTTYGVVEVRVP